jgi:hypothetical protein
MPVIVHIGAGLHFYCSEIKINSNVNLITSNQTLDMGEVGEVQAALVGSKRQSIGWKTVYFHCRFSSLNKFPVIQPNTRA